MEFCRSNRFKKLFIVLLIPVFMISGILYSPPVYADDECKDIEDTEKRIKCYEEKEEKVQEKLNSTKNKINETQSKISDLSGQLNVTQSELNEVQNNINEIKSELEIIKENLEDRYNRLSDKIEFRNKLLRTYSKRSALSDLELFFSSSRAQNLNGFQFSNFVQAFNKATNEETLNLIANLNSEISGFEKDEKETKEIKTDLETAQSNLIALNNDLANRKVLAESEQNELEEKAEGYEEELEKLQSNILALKYSSENGTVGDYASPGSSTPDPPFEPAFAAFSYGAYTHYKGMSQYGAKGRAEDGKDYEDILEFYYDEGIKEKDIDEICVEGYGNMSMKKYLYGLGEMPSSWPEDALKAQAVAARSYAYRYVKAGTCICTTQSCQVFIKSKSDDPPGDWKDAVDDTKGEILEGDVVAYYSSTTGGYIENIGWDVDGDWPKKAYENKADSPWFHKAWYTKSYADGSTCGHSHPWLTEEEMADIANAWVVWENGSSDEKSHITPLTTSCWGGDPYSKDKMREKADKYGDGYDKVTDVDVDISNSGYTSNVKLTTNKGTINIDGDTFKTVFNLRAPGYVAIRSRLYDLEKED